MTKQTHLFTTIGIGVAATALAALAGCTRPSVPAAGCRVTRRARPRPGGARAGHDMGVINATMTSFKLPFGTVYTANLTPDKDTGLGAWTD